ncbi:Cytochrome c-type biogenesis protein DsbD, protein-disulfide reductase [hydrothermal vent metagenome]|uniref:Cytochrome c-type biogenesis protein DsbD, protein-disulfide reductase n=1 Tax=hydrothermal vent metagenome TaxID=652676 RepID=A0A1W1D3A7_9ZZZZ
MKKIIAILLFFSIQLFAGYGFLTPQEAFQPNATLTKNMDIEVQIKLADKIYLYANKVNFHIKNQKNILLKVETPKPTKFHGDMVYFHTPKFLLHIDKAKLKKQVILEVSYQGCSSAGLCYPPISKEFVLHLASQQKKQSIQTPSSEVDTITKTLYSKNIFIILFTFFSFGVLLSLTPCVFPMIPIISGLIVAQGKNITTKKAFFLSLIYVLSMAVAYTIAGVFAGLFGANLQSAMQTPIVIYIFSAIFVLLALSMFGFYELKLPDKLVAKVSKNSNKSGYIGVAIMGFLSALIVGPCVAAPLAGALVYIGQTGDALLGGMALFFMSLGMGLPLIVVGVSANKFMPKPGAWMNMVSVIFGVIMLGVAIWMLDRVVSEYITMILYALLGMGFAIYLRFLKNPNFIKCTLVISLFLYSLALFIGALGGSKSFINPLSFLSSSKTQTSSLHFQTIHSIKELDTLLKQNKGKKILLDFSAKWCVACKELDEVTFQNKEVKQKLQEFVLIRADITQNTQEEKTLSQKYNVFGPPVVLFFDENGKLLENKRVVGFIKPQQFLQGLQ